MPFTTKDLIDMLSHPNLRIWANSNPENQANLLPAFDDFFQRVQVWITERGGANPFGWQNLDGLCYKDKQVQLFGADEKAVFNDAFDDVRRYRYTRDFRLFQAAQNIQRLIIFLGRIYP